jgi:addiction module HigA family antidote
MSEQIEYSDELIELTTPGEVLKEDFLDAMGVTAYELAKSIDVDPMRISRIINGTRKITADTAIRFSRFFGRFLTPVSTPLLYKPRSFIWIGDDISSCYAALYSCIWTT